MSALCRSRRELSNAYLLAKFGFDTADLQFLKIIRSTAAAAENEPCQVFPIEPRAQGPRSAASESPELRESARSSRRSARRCANSGRSPREANLWFRSGLHTSRRGFAKISFQFDIICDFFRRNFHEKFAWIAWKAQLN